MKKILIAILISSFFASFSMAECVNCSAEVVINKTNTQKFLDYLLLFSSMPLSGYQVSNDQANGYDIVRVETYQEYADTNKISSFDVANRILISFGMSQEWDIKKISAVVEKTPNDLLSNVGTIGH